MDKASHPLYYLLDVNLVTGISEILDEPLVKLEPILADAMYDRFFVACLLYFIMLIILHGCDSLVTLHRSNTLLIYQVLGRFPYLTDFDHIEYLRDTMQHVLA